MAVAAKSPAASLLVELEAAGVDVAEVSTEETAKACGRLYDSVIQRSVRHLGQPMLNIAVGAADRKFTGDTWHWSRRAQSTDISPLVAVTLAKWLHDEGVVVVPEPFVMWG